MLRKTWQFIKRGWEKYCAFIKEAGLDEGNCRRCVPIIKHDPPLARHEKKPHNPDEVLKA